jgi:hypothetical protein
MYYTGESLELSGINLKWHKEFLTYCSEVEKYGQRPTCHRMFLRPKDKRSKTLRVQ